MRGFSRRSVRRRRRQSHFLTFAERAARSFRQLARSLFRSYLALSLAKHAFSDRTNLLHVAASPAMHNGAVPDELLLLIFEAVASPAHTADEYDARQKTLSVLSRVARRYAQLARPLLWEDLRSSKRAHLERLQQVQLKDAVARGTKLFQVSTAGARLDEGEPVSPNEGAEAASCFPRVEDIRIECVRSPLDLTLLDVHVGASFQALST